jgi:hypothetical protein
METVAQTEMTAMGAQGDITPETVRVQNWARLSLETVEVNVH